MKIIKRVVFALIPLLLIALLVFLGKDYVDQIQKDGWKDMSFNQMISYTTEEDENVCITVGIIQSGSADYVVSYGQRAQVLEQVPHTYELGQLTETFTGAMVCKAASEGKLSLDDPIGNYLALPSDAHNPTIAQLLTHTAGYEETYFTKSILVGEAKSGNPYSGVSCADILNEACGSSLENESYPYQHSAFGMALLGQVVGKVYHADYGQLMGPFLHGSLGLAGSGMSDGTADLGKAWTWQGSEGFLPAMGAASNMNDMLQYGHMLLTGNPEYLGMARSLFQEETDSAEAEEELDLFVDGMGAGWRYDASHDAWWCAGETDHYSSYMAVSPSSGIAIVILSNQAEGQGIPAKYLGGQLLTEMNPNL